MPASMSVTIDGQDRILRALERLGMPKAEPIYREALTENMGDTLATSRTQFLSGQRLRVRTGRLRSSLVIDKSELPAAIRGGSTHPGAAPLQWGWPGKNIRARLFLSDALDIAARDFREPWLRRLEDAWGRGL